MRTLTSLEVYTTDIVWLQTLAEQHKLCIMLVSVIKSSNEIKLTLTRTQLAFLQGNRRRLKSRVNGIAARLLAELEVEREWFNFKGFGRFWLSTSSVTNDYSSVPKTLSSESRGLRSTSRAVPTAYTKGHLSQTMH